MCVCVCCVRVCMCHASSLPLCVCVRKPFVCHRRTGAPCEPAKPNPPVCDNTPPPPEHLCARTPNSARPLKCAPLPKPRAACARSLHAMQAQAKCAFHACVRCGACPCTARCKPGHFMNASYALHAVLAQRLWHRRFHSQRGSGRESRRAGAQARAANTVVRPSSMNHRSKRAAHAALAQSGFRHFWETRGEDDAAAHSTQHTA